jgi:hypothetical protein
MGVGTDSKSCFAEFKRPDDERFFCRRYLRLLNPVPVLTGLPMPRPRFTLRWMLIATAIVALVVAFAEFLRSALGPIESDEIIAKLVPGMREAEVERLLGKPDRVDANGDWVYEKPYNPGWLGIHFDERRRLIYHDHEPLFP